MLRDEIRLKGISRIYPDLVIFVINIHFLLLSLITYIYRVVLFIMKYNTIIPNRESIVSSPFFSLYFLQSKYGVTNPSSFLKVKVSFKVGDFIWTEMPDKLNLMTYFMVSI